METDPRISQIFYYFAEHTTIESGRTVGRKIGGVQEIIVKKLLLQSPTLRDSLLFEQPLWGRSGATHKVEFSVHPVVGSVQVNPGEEFTVSGAGCVVRQISSGVPRVWLTSAGERTSVRLPLHGSTSIPGTDGMRLKAVGVTGTTARFVVLDERTVLASIESKRVGAQRFAGTEKLGAGIQTIEEAKQASLVALDLDLRQTGTIKPLGEGSRQFLSIVVLGNGVHWNENDLNVLCTYVDHVFLVPDETIIRYAEFIRTEAEANDSEFFPYFMAYFRGLVNTPEDEFVVTTDDLQRICPWDDKSPLVAVLENHVREHSAR